ncbi:MAG TPA: hypothetical protein VK886_22115 [Vicinamibacterales bacterium]|nr:hypothetical protein [Vicinamibacterales bacterium]
MDFVVQLTVRLVRTWWLTGGSRGLPLWLQTSSAENAQNPLSLSYLGITAGVDAALYTRFVYV